MKDITIDQIISMMVGRKMYESAQIPGDAEQEVVLEVET